MRLIFQIIISICVLFSCKQRENLMKFKGYIFGTSYTIIYDAHHNYKHQIDSIFDVVNQSMSIYIPNSDISKINDNKEVFIDSMFVEVFKKAKRIHKETDGYFDPTIGQLINFYGFGAEKIKDTSDKRLKKIKSLVGFQKVTIKDRKVYKQNPEIKFDVNALAKGYGIDVVGRFLEQKNIKNYLIEIGGEIRARGLKKGNPWKIAIENPNTDGTQSFNRIIELTNKSMATSGNYRKFRVDSLGNKYVHIVNPKTGLARESNLLSASVIADGDCADVDAYATAFMAMGLEKTKYFLKKYPHLKVILIYRDDKKELQVFEN